MFETTQSKKIDKILTQKTKTEMSSRLPSLNLRLGDFQAHKKNENEISNVLVRTDSEMKKHTITLTITDKEIGTAEIELE